MINPEEQAKKKKKLIIFLTFHRKKLQILEALQNGNKTQTDIAQEFSVDPATVWQVKQQGKQFKEKLAQTAGAVTQTKRIREG
jgi:transposase-like protein